jgi:hypothetical protein
MRLAVGQCPTECIHYVTLRQCAALEALLLRHVHALRHACVLRSVRGVYVCGR